MVVIKLYLDPPMHGKHCVTCTCIDENQKNPSVPIENLKYKTVPRDVFPILHQSQNLF